MAKKKAAKNTEVLLVAGEAGMGAGEIAAALAQAYGEIMAFINTTGVELNGLEYTLEPQAPIYYPESIYLFSF